MDSMHLGAEMGDPVPQLVCAFCFGCQARSHASDSGTVAARRSVAVHPRIPEPNTPFRRPDRAASAVCS